MHIELLKNYFFSTIFKQYYTTKVKIAKIEQYSTDINKLISINQYKSIIVFIIKFF